MIWRPTAEFFGPLMLIDFVKDRCMVWHIIHYTKGVSSDRGNCNLIDPVAIDGWNVSKILDMFTFRYRLGPLHCRHVQLRAPRTKHKQLSNQLETLLSGLLNNKSETNYFRQGWVKSWYNEDYRAPQRKRNAVYLLSLVEEGSQLNREFQDWSITT